MRNLKIRGAVSLLALAALVSGCGARNGPSSQNTQQLTAEDEAAITQAVAEILRAKKYRPGVSGGIYSCSQYFTVGTPKVVDTSLTGDSGKLRVSVPITALAPEDLGPLYAPSSRYQYPVQYCYGYPNGGWSQGQTAHSDYVVSIEHWQSGWRMSANEPLAQN